MADLPAEGKFKIGSIGPVKTGTAKKTGNPWKVYSLQFQDDPQWYDTFWTMKEDPTVGMELEGKKSFDEEFTSYKFDIKREGGKFNYNPAAANATVLSASAQIIGAFLALPGHYELWKSGSEELKPLFTKYLETVNVASKRVKDMVVGMGSLNAESQTQATTTAQNNGDPGPTAPPDIATYPGNGGSQPGDEEELPI